MADVRPRRNLPLDSEPWGRRIEADLDTALSRTDYNSQHAENAFKSINSSMTLITRQIASLNALTQTLAQQQQALAEANAALSAQQGALTNVVNSVAAVSANQVTGATTSNSNGSPIGVGNGGNYVGASVTVPGGYTRAVVMGTSSIRIVGGANMALYLSVNINGAVGTPFPVFADSGSSVTTAATASHAATLNGLTPGSTITIYGRTTSVSSVSGAYFSNAASVIFLK